MKDNLLALGMFIGFFLLAFSGLIIPITLLNDYLIYGSVLFVGIIVSVGYIFIKKIKFLTTLNICLFQLEALFVLAALLFFRFCGEIIFTEIMNT